MALVSFRLFSKNLGNLEEFFGQIDYRPPWQKIARTPMTVQVRRKESDLVLYCLVNLISFEIFNTKFLLKSCPQIHAMYVSKRGGPPD